MNGIYDFEGYRTPYLDVEMLMERKAKKRERQMLILSCIVAVMMTAASVLTLVATAFVSKEVFVILATAFGLYIILGAIGVGTFLKKRGEELWQQLA